MASGQELLAISKTTDGTLVSKEIFKMNYYLDENGTLYHHGIQGQKWGVQNGPPYPLDSSQLSSYEKKYSSVAKNGKTIELVRQKPKGLLKVSKRKDLFYDYDAFVDGKKVSQLNMYDEGNGEMNVAWASTKNKSRGNGYMQAVIELGEQIAKDNGFTKMTAELVGDSPDIYHIIVDKQKWDLTGEKIETDNMLDVWGGLILVEKNL